MKRKICFLFYEDVDGRLAICVGSSVMQGMVQRYENGYIIVIIIIQKLLKRLKGLVKLVLWTPTKLHKGKINANQLFWRQINSRGF